jgi:FkbM family methyltransferase
MSVQNNPVRRHAVRAARKILGAIPFDTAMILARELLATQGFGGGGDVGSSGEAGVFRLVKSKDPVLFDCGGHVGDYTGLWLKSFPTGRSFVFEPSVSHLTLLDSRFAKNSAVRVFAHGLGAEHAHLPLYKDADISGLASLSQRRLDHHGIIMGQSETVEICPLDDVVEQLNIKGIDLLKIDVEGHELSVLHGAVRTLRKGTIKLVQFEFGGCNLDTHTNLQDFFYFFKEHDMAVGVVQPTGRVQLLERYEEFFEQYRTSNFVAARPSLLNT